ncbi:MAG: hypothetical protein OXG24_02230 [Gammaproteobacteria bacterium]|nr:hypothetical protein [Gammaproteobacteria bacterium]
MYKLGIVTVAVILAVTCSGIVRGKVASNPLSPDTTRSSITTKSKSPLGLLGDPRDSAEIQLADVTIGSLEALCPDVHYEMSDECFTALDQHFLNSAIPEYEELRIVISTPERREKHPDDPNKVLVTMTTGSWSGFIPLDDSPTFDFVFRDPSANKRRAMAALEKEQCQLSKGPIRRNLLDSCDANSLIGFAMFLDVCQKYELEQIRQLRPRGKSLQNSYDRDLDWISEDHFENLDTYHRARAETLQKSFRDAWVVQKCNSFDDDLFSPSGIVNPPGKGVRRYRRDDYLNATRDEISSANLNWANRQAVKDLYAITARLGHRWALAAYRLPFPHEDLDFWDSLSKESPFVYHFYMYRTPAVQLEKIERIKHAILAHAHATAMDLPEMSDWRGVRNLQQLNTHLSAVEPYSQEQLEQARAQVDNQLKKVIRR